jgi:hypothetical protein
MAAIATPTVEAPVITQIPTTPSEIAEIGTELSALQSPIVGGQNQNGIELFASSYNWNLTYDFNVNWRVAVGSPATGHHPSCATRDLFVAWTPPA